MFPFATGNATSDSSSTNTTATVEVFSFWSLQEHMPATFRLAGNKDLDANETTPGSGDENEPLTPRQNVYHTSNKEDWRKVNKEKSRRKTARQCRN